MGGVSRQREKQLQGDSVRVLRARENQGDDAEGRGRDRERGTGSLLCPNVTRWHSGWGWCPSCETPQLMREPRAGAGALCAAPAAHSRLPTAPWEELADFHFLGFAFLSPPLLKMPFQQNH